MVLDSSAQMHMCTHAIFLEIKIKKIWHRLTWGNCPIFVSLTSLHQSSKRLADLEVVYGFGFLWPRCCGDIVIFLVFKV